MEVMLDGQLVTCTPEEYMELKRLGAFGGKPAEQGTAPKKQGYKDWLGNGMTHVIPVYGCVIDTSMLEGKTAMLDGKYIFNPDTCTPGTETCGRCQRDEYCEKARAAKKEAAQAHRDA